MLVYGLLAGAGPVATGFLQVLSVFLLRAEAGFGILLGLAFFVASTAYYLYGVHLMFQVPRSFNAFQNVSTSLTHLP